MNEFKFNLQFFGGRGATSSKGGSVGGAGGIGTAAEDTTPTNPIEDKNFDVNKQIPTKATDLDNMNEAQLAREIIKLERRASGAEREAEAAFNSGSMRRFNEMSYQFPGGVGPSAVTASYRKMVDRAMSQAVKGVEAKKRAEDYAARAERYKKAYDVVKGSGLLVHEAKTARAAVGGKLDGKWTKTDNAYVDSTFGKISGQKNGDFTVGKSWASYHVYRGNRPIGKFNKAADAKAIIEKYASK